MGIVRVGIDHITSPSFTHAAIPGLIKRFPFIRTDIANVGVLLLEPPDDVPFLFGGGAVDDQNLEPIAKRLGCQISQAAFHEPLTCIRRDQGGDPWLIGGFRLCLGVGGDRFID